MKEIQTIIDYVRAVLASGNYNDTASLQVVADDFRRTTLDLNKRLQRVTEYLRSGLRSEAIHEAESAPKLLDSVGILHSLTEEELTEWGSVCEFLELQPPGSLLADAAEMMDEAYEDYELLEPLLRTQRRLALHRAPLSKRLPVLRQIAAQDPDTEFWQVDLVSLEEARLAEIRSEAKALSKKPSRAALSALRAELGSGSWQTPVPHKLVAAVTGLLKTATRNRSQTILRKAEEELRQAQASMDYESARPAYQAWTDNLEAAGFDSDDPLILAAVAPVAWFEHHLAVESSEGEWQAFLHKVESSVSNDSTTVDELETLASKANRLDRPLPDDVIESLRGQLLAKRTNRTRRRTMIGTIAVGVLVTCVGLAVFVVMNIREQTDRSNAVAQLAAYTEAGELSEAEELVASTGDRWQGLPDWIKATQAVSELKRTLEARKESIERLYFDAGAVDDTDEARFVGLRDEALSLSEEKPLIEGLATTTSARFRELAKGRIDRKQKRETVLRERLDAQVQSISGLEESLKQLDRDEYQTMSRRIGDGLRLIASDARGYDSRIREDITFYSEKLKDLGSTFQLYAELNDLYLQLPALARFGLKSEGVSTYAQSLKRYSEICDDKDESQQLVRTLEESKCWTSMMNFGKGLRFVEVPSSIDVVTKLELVRGLPTSPAISPHVESLKELQELFVTLLTRRHAPNNVLDRITTRLGDQDMKLFMVNKIRPYVYLADGQLLPVKGGRVSIDRWYKNGDVRKDTVKSRDQILKPIESPQVAVRRELQRLLPNLKDDLQWEATLAHMGAKILAAEKVDPVLRVRLLHYLMSRLRESSLTVGDQEDFLKFYGQCDSVARKVAKFPWGASEDDFGDRQTAQEFIDGYYSEGMDRIESWVPPSTGIESVLRKFRRTYRSVGWMAPKSGGTEVTVPQVGKWQLCIVVPKSRTENAASVVTIGTAVDGEITLEAANEKSFQAGRLVFAYELIP